MSNERRKVGEQVARRIFEYPVDQPAVFRRVCPPLDQLFGSKLNSHPWPWRRGVYAEATCKLECNSPSSRPTTAAKTATSSLFSRVITDRQAAFIPRKRTVLLVVVGFRSIYAARYRRIFCLYFLPSFYFYFLRLFVSNSGLCVPVIIREE